MSQEAHSPQKEEKLDHNSPQVQCNNDNRDDDDLREDVPMQSIMTSTPTDADKVDCENISHTLEDYVADKSTILSVCSMSLTDISTSIHKLDCENIFHTLEAYVADNSTIRSVCSMSLTDISTLIQEQNKDSGILANTSECDKDSTESEPKETPSVTSSPSPFSVWDTDFHKTHMTAISSEKFDSLLKMTPDLHSCKSHMAVFVLVREVMDSSGHACYDYQVVAVGSGRLSCTSFLCFNGTMLHDCHAMAVARRALQRFLYKQVLLFFESNSKDNEACIFESGTAGSKLQLKAKTSLHLYTNQCPEGAAMNFCSWSSGQKPRGPPKLQYHAKGLLVLAAHLDPSHRAAKVCCMSGTHKLFMWTFVGVQGAQLSHFIQPLYITSMVLGGQKQYIGYLSDIANECLGDGWDDILPPFYKKNGIIFLRCGEAKSVEVLSQDDVLSVNWCLGDKDIEVVDSSKGFINHSSPSVSGPSFSSRLCKRAFYSYFRQVAQVGGHGYLLVSPTYRSIKVEATVYQTIKKLVKKYFQDKQAGPWKAKMLVDCFSA